MTKKQKGVTNWPEPPSNARLANGYMRFAYEFKHGGAFTVKSDDDCFTEEGFFFTDKVVGCLDITHLNKKLTPAGIAHKEAGWPYGVPDKGLER